MINVTLPVGVTTSGCWIDCTDLILLQPQTNLYSGMVVLKFEESSKNSATFKPYILTFQVKC